MLQTMRWSTLSMLQPWMRALQRPQLQKQQLLRTQMAKTRSLVRKRQKASMERAACCKAMTWQKGRHLILVCDNVVMSCPYKGHVVPLSQWTPSQPIWILGSIFDFAGSACTLQTYQQSFSLHCREPLHAGADRVPWWELIPLASHAHPSVAAMARQLLAAAPVVYNGDPLRDLSLSNFLDAFVQRKPKVLPTSQPEMIRNSLCMLCL